MTWIVEDLANVEKLLRELSHFSEGLDGLNQLLKHIFLESKIVYVCSACGVYENPKSKKCEILGEERTLVKVIKVNTRGGGVGRINYQFYFTQESLDILELLVKNHKNAIAHFQSVKVINLMKDLKISPNYPLEKTYVHIFILLHLTDDGSFKRDIELVELMLSDLSKLAQQENIVFNKLERFSPTGHLSRIKNQSSIDNTISMLFSKTNRLLELVKEIEIELNLIRESKTLNRINDLCKRRIPFMINPSELSKHLNGKIEVVIRHTADDYSSEIIVPMLQIFLKGIEKYGSIDKYYAKMQLFIKEAFERMIKDHWELFYEAYGKKLDLTFYIDIQNYPGGMKAAGFACRVKHLFRHHEKIAVSDSERSSRNLEVNISSDFLYDSINSNDLQGFLRVMVHETGHFLDKKINNTSLIRQEGIARFTEFAHIGNAPKFNIEVVRQLKRNPINCKKDYDALDSEIGAAEGHFSWTPYWLGEYICIVIFVGILKKHFPDLKIDVLKRQDLVMDKEKLTHAKLLLRMLRQMPDKQFFNYYLKYTSELNIKPIITAEYANSFDK